MSDPAEVFELQPGPAAAVTMAATGAIAERLTATNGSAPQQRALLRGAAAQLQDAWGNAVAQAGVRVQISLQWPPEGPPGTSRAVVLSVPCPACSYQAPESVGSALRKKCTCGPGAPRQLFEAVPSIFEVVCICLLVLHQPKTVSHSWQSMSDMLAPHSDLVLCCKSAAGNQLPRATQCFSRLHQIILSSL